MTSAPASQSQFVIFCLQGREYALPVSQVVEVLRMVALTPLPQAPAWLAGLLNLRGCVIPVIDLRIRLGLMPQAAGPDAAIVVACAKQRSLGLIADAVVEILAISAEAIEPPDTLAGSGHAVAGVARVGARLIMIADIALLCGGVEDMASKSE